MSAFTGPLDLLLHLVKEDELQLEEIPVARVAEQYVAYLEKAQSLDLDVASEFLVMAATLVEMKSRALLPRESVDLDLDEDEGPDPQEQLVRMLLQYRRYKHLAFQLEEMKHERARRYTRPVRMGLPAPELGPPLEEVSLEDLRQFYVRVAQETLMHKARTIFMDDVPLVEHIKRIRTVVDERDTVLLSELYPNTASVPMQVGTFLGLLELIRGRVVGIEQEVPFADVRIFRRDESEHSGTIDVYDEMEDPYVAVSDEPAPEPAEAGDEAVSDPPTEEIGDSAEPG
ncbi:MAG: segregation and condensation protein A [Planctomycetota bacterium]|jgi:segregation and condensation protein A